MRYILAAGFLGLAGCATTPMAAPVEVMRFHVDEVGRGTVAVVPPPGGPAADDLTFRNYAAAVEQELGAQGYATASAGGASEFVAELAVTEESRPVPSRRSPVSVGLGAGGYSGGWRRGGVGLGGGISFPIGRSKPRQLTATTVTLTIRRRTGTGNEWEGRATTQTLGGTSEASTRAARLAHALFLGFPGESGRTIEVK